MYLEKPTSSTYENVPAGNHVAVCTRFIDLGTQKIVTAGETSYKHKVLVSWEFPHELMTSGDNAGKPFRTDKRYTWSMHEKASLRQDLESWRGKAFTDADFEGPERFNVKNILGKGCMIQIVQETKGENTYSNIKSIAGLPKGTSAPAPSGELIYFSLVPEFFNNATLDGLSDKLKETIKSSPQFLDLVGGNSSSPPRKEIAGFTKPAPRNSSYNLDDEVPF